MKRATPHLPIVRVHNAWRAGRARAERSTRSIARFRRPHVNLWCWVEPIYVISARTIELRWSYLYLCGPQTKFSSKRCTFSQTVTVTDRALRLIQLRSGGV
eukprot:3084372-Pyramimonas_sp.AAC.2